jgi:hypothetical protein
MENFTANSVRYVNSVNYRKMVANLLALAFLVSGMAIALYLGAFP